MGQGRGETVANPVQKGKDGESLVPKIELYFGLFFDGTNNNKLQVLLGKRYRREQYLHEILDKVNKCQYNYHQILALLNNGIIDSLTVRFYKTIPTNKGPQYVLDSEIEYSNRNISEFTVEKYNSIQKKYASSEASCTSKCCKSGNCLVQNGRSFWEKGDLQGVLSQSQLDNLFFGYEGSDAEDKYFIEERISKQLDSDNNGEKKSANIGWDKSEKTEHFTFASADANTNLRIKAEADSFVNEDEQESQTNYFSPSQSSTYTNVVILESLYDASLAHNKDDGSVRKYYSLYVEGSGSDMKFNPPVFGHMHLMGPGVFGLGKGTGDTGAVAKVMKMSRQVKSIVSGFTGPTKLYFDIFGFSRGATEARMFNYLLNPKKDAEIRDKLKKVNENNINDYELFTGSSNEYLKDSNIITEKKVRFLGIYDTVSSIGVLRENWLTSSIKEKAIDFVGNFGEKLDTLANKLPEFLSQVGDKASAIFVRFLYEKTINHPTQLANIILTGFSPDFFTLNHQLGTEDLLNIILAKFPFDKLPKTQDTKPIIEALRDGIKSIRENYVEKYETYIKEKRLSCMEDPNVSIFGKSKYHDQNVVDYGLYTTDQAEEVFHICALDEVRSNFALVDIESSVYSNGLELFLPGCHTDIGGGTGLGRDNQKIANISAFNGTPNFVCKTKPFDKNNMEYVPLTSDGLMLAGWIDSFDNRVKGSYLRNIPTDNDLETDGTAYSDNADSWIHTPNIVMSRYVKPGYCNIGLNLMQKRANKDKSRKMFHPVPGAYQVPEDLTEYYDIIQKRVDCETNGRIFVNPTSGKYRELRHEWIHFSANEQILSLADNILVNPPNYVGAFTNNPQKILIKDRLILKGGEINTTKQEHPFLNVGRNLTKALVNPRTYLFSFPLNASTVMNVFSMTDAMLASRIIYKGDKEKHDPSKPIYMFDYLQGGKLIDVSLKNTKNEQYLHDLISILNAEKERARRFVEMCRDMQMALGKLVDEELFFMKVNALRLTLNNADQVLPSIKTETIPLQRATSMLSMTGAMVDPEESIPKKSIISGLTITKIHVDGEVSISDLASPILEHYIEETRKQKHFGQEASNAFIDVYTNVRDTIQALPKKYQNEISATLQNKALGKLPSQLKIGSTMKFWAIWFLVNAPEVGKLFGHTAGLIHDYRKVADWKKQEEYGLIKIKVLDEQINMIEQDLQA